MSELHTTDVPGWIHSSIQGEVLTDASVNKARLLPKDSVPVVVAPEFAEHFAHSDTQLSSLSENHGRSYEVGTNMFTRQFGGIAVWLDEFQNPYTSYSLKGNNFSSPEVYKSSTAPSGYIAHGLLENDALLRAVRSSRILREAHVSTEWINRVFEPQELIFNGDRISPDEYKSRILNQAAKVHGLEEMAMIAKVIEPMSFYVTGRSMEINDRVNDFNGDSLLGPRLKHTFRMYNHLHREDEDFEPLLQAENKHSIRQATVERYFDIVLPSLIGRNLARIHNLGLIHKFPHLGNITSLGGFVDLDSISGPALEMDDEPNTIRNYLDDLHFLLEDDDNNRFKILYNILERKGIFTQRRSAERAQQLLHDAYTKERKFENTDEGSRESIIVSSKVSATFNHTEFFDIYEKVTGKSKSELSNSIYEEIRAEIAMSRTEERLYKKASILSDYILSVIAAKFLEEGKPLENATSYVVETISNGLEFESRLLDTKGIYELAHALVLSSRGEEINQRFIGFAEETDVYIKFMILRGIISSMNKEVSADVSENMKAILEARVKKVEQTFLSNFASQEKEEDYTFYARTIDGFYCVNNHPEADVIITNNKSIYAYDSISFTRLINAARKAKINLVLSDLPEVDTFIQGKKEDRPRSTFTDSSSTSLQQVMLKEDDYTVAVHGGRDLTYLAWLYEPTNPGDSPTLEISHHNKEKALKQLLKSGPVDVA